MSALTMSYVARATGGRLVGGDAPLGAVSTDSRTIPAGALFVALKGPSFDGHEFVPAALARGAVGALVERELPHPVPQVVCPDSLEGLQSVARAWRREFRIPFVGITGSNGKTTTKEMIGAILTRLGPCLVTQGNLNNHIGVPLTLLRLTSEHQSAVIEMGANHQGEIASLAAIAEPAVGIVTNAGEAHLEGFGGIEGVAKGKGEMFRALPADGVAIINRDDRFFDFWQGNSSATRRLTFGLTAAADFHPKNVRKTLSTSGFRFDFDLSTPSGSAPCSLAFAGDHNLRNAMGAAAAASAAGASLEHIVAGLKSVRAVFGRLNLLPALNGAHLLDDSYNANPSSLRAGIEALCSLPGEHWLVLGDMLELGSNDNELHAQMGEFARKAGVARLFAVGARARHAVEAFGNDAEWFENVETLIPRVQGLLKSDSVVLIKGSRANRLERVTAALVGNAGLVSNGH